MSCYSGPAISNSNLVLSLDPANVKSLPWHPGTTDHGISDWYCFVSGTATYSFSEPNTSLYQVTNLGVVSTITSSVNPTRGTIAVTAGYRYYGNNPINLVVEDQQHSIAPISMAEKMFIYAAGRAGSEAGTLYFYAPYSAATVTIYTGGVNGTVLGSVSVPACQQNTFSLTVLGNYYIVSTTPIVASATQIITDKTILSPVKLTSYQRYPSWSINSIGGTPNTQTSYVVADTTYPVITQQIADGSGGDTAQGLAYEYLCDRYSWGNTLDDYVIVAPYPNSIITTYYWNGTAWVVWESHNLSGTQLNPAQVQRDGTQGTGVTATDISGTASNLVAGATLWKWEGNNPFYLCINDSTDDEFSVLGWMNARNKRTVSDLDTNMYDLSGTGNTVTLVNNPTFSTNKLLFTPSLNTYINVPANTKYNFLGTAPYTLEAWIYPTSNPGANNWTGIFDRESNPGSGRDGYNLYFVGSADTTTTIRSERWWSGVSTSTFITLDQSVSVNNWHHIVATYDGSLIRIYRNGVFVAASSSAAGSITNTAKNLTIGVRDGNYFNGGIGATNIYSSALTAAEILQNFNAHRSMYGI